MLREADAERKRHGEADALQPPTQAPDPTVLYTPVTSPPKPLGRSKSPAGTPIDRARPPLGPNGNRDIRMYSREWTREEIDGQVKVVTTVRCLALVDGEWQSRIVDVRVDDSSE